MIPIEEPNEAEWDAFHEWLDEWAKENKLNPSQAKRLVESSGEMLEALRYIVIESHMDDDEEDVWRIVEEVKTIAIKAIAKAEAKP